MGLGNFYKPGIKVQRYSTIDDGMGGYTEDWADQYVISGLIDYLSGREENIAASVREKATHLLITDAGPELKHTDRIVYNNDIYRVLLVDNPMGLDHHLEIILEKSGVDNT